MNISKLKQTTNKPAGLPLQSVVAGSIMSLCLITNSSVVHAANSLPFPVHPPLEMNLAQGISSNKVLLKLELAAPVGTASEAVQAANSAKVAALAAEFDVKIVPLLEEDDPKKWKVNPRLSQVYVAEFPAGTDIEKAIKDFQADPAVEYAEVNGVMEAIQMPNDPYFDYQWALHNYGQSGGTPDADINALEGWDISQGDEEILLAVVDTGVDPTHQDLSGKVIEGYDFANNDSNPMDDHGHGTHVSGSAAANSNEGIGIAGVCWNCRIMPVKVLTGGGWGYWEWVADGIAYATQHDADVINLSLGGYSGSKVLHDAIIDAYNAGVTVVAAAGNGGGPPVGYPAAYEESIAVSATDHNDQLAWFSSWGPEVDIAAPGVDILSSLPHDNYAFWNGTSMATPHVTGAIGVCLSLNPSLSPAQVRDYVMESADDLPPDGEDDYFGAGRLNLATLLGMCGGKKECMGEACTIEGEGGIIYGTSGDDVICGSDEKEIILAKAGNDLICAGGGDDIIVADLGHDKVDAGPGDDIVKGNSGRDVLKGGPGTDILLGSTENDVLVGSIGDDYLHGGDGNDVLLGHDGNDQLCGSTGKDYLNAGEDYLNAAGFDNDKCDEKGKGCDITESCPIINVLELDPSLLTPGLMDSINTLNGLGATDINQ